MAEYFFSLSETDQREALEVAGAATGRPAHLLEKDLWVVWTLQVLFDSPLATDLTFKAALRFRRPIKSLIASPKTST